MPDLYVYYHKSSLRDLPSEKEARKLQEKVQHGVRHLSRSPQAPDPFCAWIEHVAGL